MYVCHLLTVGLEGNKTMLQLSKENSRLGLIYFSGDNLFSLVQGQLTEQSKGWENRSKKCNA